MAQPFKKLFYVLAISGLVLVNFIAQPVFAVAPQDLQILISDSRPSTSSDYTITHDQATTTGDFSAGDTLVITFPAGFDLTPLSEPGDYDFVNDAEGTPVEETLITGGCTATDSINVSVSGQAITYEACSAFVGEAAGVVIKLEIGTVASGGTNQIVNHATPATYSISSDSTDEDSKDALIVVISGVTVSATVDESLTVSVNAVAAGALCDDNGGAPSEITTTATTVPFATITTEAFYNGCQRIDVGTNAAGGYNTTVRQTQLLTSGSNTVAEGTCDSGTPCSDTSLGGWEDPTANGFGYCADDRSGNAAADAGIASGSQCDDATPEYYTFFTAPTAPTTDFMFSSGPISGDQTNISYHISVPGDQAAGTYQNVMVYVVTATF